MKALHVIFRVGDAEYALPAAEVLQMESYQGATPVPGSAPWVAGLVQVRGRVIPVIDLRQRFGLPPAPLTLDTRLVVGQAGDRAVGLVVDSGREVLQLEEAELAPPPALLTEQVGNLVRAVARVKSRLLLLLDFSRLVAEEAVHA